MYAGTTRSDSGLTRLEGVGERERVAVDGCERRARWSYKVNVEGTRQLVVAWDLR